MSEKGLENLTHTRDILKADETEEISKLPTYPS